MKKFIFYIFLMSFYTAIKAQDYSSYTKCAEQDSFALVAFYNATGGSNWTSQKDGFGLDNLSDDVATYYNTTYPNAGLGKWLEGPVKNWFGVLLEKQATGTGSDSVWRVIHLRPTISRRSAGDNNLKGYVPREVGLLTALKWFKVNGNVGLKNTELPDEIYHPTLTAFDVEAVYFRGILTSALRNCTNLQYFNPRYNYFDSIPTLDFLSSSQLLTYFAGNTTLWVYNNQISFANWEKSLSYFRSFSNSKKIYYEARQLTNVGRASEIVVTAGQQVVLTSNEAGTNGVYKYWYKNGYNTYKKGQTYTISSASASDTGYYQVAMVNDTVRLGDQNSDYGTEPYSKSKSFHVTFTPSIPTCLYNKTSYEGDCIYLTFSKPMAVPFKSEYSQFTVTENGTNISVNKIVRTGRLSDTYILYLSEPLNYGSEVLLSYSEGDVSDVNTGKLATFSDLKINNYARPVPKIVSASSSNDGASIDVTFDSFINSGTIKSSDFKVWTSKNITVTSAELKSGDIDDTISKTVTLILNDTLSYSDTISLAFTSGNLSGLYSGLVKSVDSVNVSNTVIAVKYPVKLYFVDGSKKLTHPIIKGSINSTAVKMYDDGTNADKTASDHTWTISLEKTTGTYTWKIYERSEVTSYDTVKTTDGEGNITLNLTKQTSNSDSLISSSLNVNVSDFISGDTLFGIYDKNIVFKLNMTNYNTQYPTEKLNPYLMGIDQDWTTGLAMGVSDSSSSQIIYSLSFGGYNTGDTIYFSFRNGTVWDYNEPIRKTHIVTSSDTLEYEFGTATNGIKTLSTSSDLTVYPNPVSQHIYLKGIESNEVNKVKIYNTLGKCLKEYDNTGNEYNVEYLPKGIYVIEIITNSSQSIKKCFLKI